jgi:phosphoribosyl 1,2-cyclic phosphate phosphodiesterase
MPRVTVLGSGTSSGVPLIGCQCGTCTSADPHDTRLRTSVLIQDGERAVLVDTSSDFRQQMLRHHVRHLDAVFFTHHHFDHISGFDDIRAYNFLDRRSMPCFGTTETLDHLLHFFGYAFAGTTSGSSAPRASLMPVVPGVTTDVGGIALLPVPLRHGPIATMGVRIERFAYCTDCNGIDEESIAMLEGLDVLILDALRVTHHPTHFSLEQAIAMAERIGARTTYFTHLAHEMRHAAIEPFLPPGMHLAYDGLVIDLP